MTILKIAVVLILVSQILLTAEFYSLWEATRLVIGIVLFGAYMKCEGYE